MANARGEIEDVVLLAIETEQLANEPTPACGDAWLKIG
jgi:hypothetical protein